MKTYYLYNGARNAWLQDDMRSWGSFAGAANLYREAAVERANYLVGVEDHAEIYVLALEGE